MCIARVGKVESESRGRGRVAFFDGRSLEGIDLGAVDAHAGDFVEVFGDLALQVLTAAEAKRRRAAWEEVRRASRLGEPKAVPL